MRLATRVGVQAVAMSLLLVTVLSPVQAPGTHPPGPPTEVRATSDPFDLGVSIAPPTHCLPPPDDLCDEDLLDQVHAGDPFAVKVVWRPPKDRGDGGDPTLNLRYEVWRATDPQGPFARVAALDPSAEGRRDEGLDPTENYFYKVRLVNVFGPGAFSEVVCAAPGPWAGPLESPVGAPCDPLL